MRGVSAARRELRYDRERAWEAGEDGARAKWRVEMTGVVLEWYSSALVSH